MARTHVSVPSSVTPCTCCETVVDLALQAENCLPNDLEKRIREEWEARCGVQALSDLVIQYHQASGNAPAADPHNTDPGNRAEVVGVGSPLGCIDSNNSGTILCTAVPAYSLTLHACAGVTVFNPQLTACLLQAHGWRRIGGASCMSRGLVHSWMQRPYAAFMTQHGHCLVTSRPSSV